MSKGMIFDIKEFALNDGPGIRLTIFMKGCSLRCKWCHNPEGISFEPQMNYKTNHFVGNEWTVDALIEKIIKFKDVYELSDGGVTFSGGEPTCQADFLYEVAKKIPQIHKTLDTSGFCDTATFEKLINVFDLIYFDLKLIDDDLHQQYTNVSNKTILKNLAILAESGIPYHIRIPLIPSITDTKENLENIKNVIFSLKNKPLRVDPLPYNICAGGKYPSYEMDYPLKNCEKLQNDSYVINEFKKELKQKDINIMGEDVKCYQNA